MPYFFIRAINQEGVEERIFDNFSDETQAINAVESRNLYLVDIYRIPEAISFLLAFFNFSGGRRGVNLPELAELFENMSAIYRAGVPITTGIKDIASSVENKKIRKTLEAIYIDLNSGVSIYEAFSKHVSIFGDIPVMLIKIGEETGSLEKIFKDISLYYKRISDIKSKAKQALIYPAFVITGVLGAMLFWMIYVFPKMASFFSDFGVELPFITKATLSVSNFLSGNIKTIFLIAVLSFFAFKFLRKKSLQFKTITDKLMLKLPVLGIVLKYFYSAFISEYIKVMIRAGVSIVRALDVMKDSVNNEVYRKAINNIHDMVLSGQSISESFKAQNIFSPMIVRMINIGENTGSLDQQFDYIAAFFYEKLEYITQNITKMIEPIVMSIVGVFFVIIILSFLIPVYELISKIQM